MRIGFLCLLLSLPLAVVMSAQSTTQTPKAAAAYWHQKKDWHRAETPAITSTRSSSGQTGQYIDEYWQSTHPNIIVCPRYIWIGGGPPCFGTGGSQSSGSVFSGSNPVVGASVYLFAAGTGGYGQPSTPILISISGETYPDANGYYYAITDSNGLFNINGAYDCSPGTQIYAYAVGGNLGSGEVGNSAIGELALLGTCPTAPSTFPYISMTEVTTVAAAYAMAGFAVDATDVSSSGTLLAQVGIANAFLNAGNLVSLSTGTALNTTPSGNGTVPQATLNTLANILASCIDSNAGSSVQCSGLFNIATSDGTSTGTPPTDTATAAIYIAHNPGANVANLFGFSNAANQSPYAPSLTTQPNDFTVGIPFTGGGISVEPYAIAIDGQGNVWIANTRNDKNTVNQVGNSVSELTSYGAPLSPSTGYTGGGLSFPYAIAVDSLGNAWVTNNTTNLTLNAGDSITEITSAGVATGFSYPLSLNLPAGVAIDTVGDIWVANYGGNSLTELNSDGSYYQTLTGYGTTSADAIAIDSYDDLWVPNIYNPPSSLTKIPINNISSYSIFTAANLDLPSGIAVGIGGDAWITNYNNSVTELSNRGVNLANSPYTGGNLDSPLGLAVDGAGNAWVTNGFNNNIVEISSLGIFLSGGNGYVFPNAYAADSCAIDGSGNVWIASFGFDSVTELIGAATPVVTPLSAGVTNGTLGSRP